ncbi:MAG: ferrous iron transport protein B [Planctomycetota bacterium]
MSGPTEAPAATLHIALAGNPNSGKTSLFNALTGLRHKVGNYPGVTVERIEGRLALPDGTRAAVVDLPGCYSLYAVSEDERIARNVLLGLVPGAPRPDVVVAVVDATSLERNLYFATQLMETGVRVCVALNMVDLAERRGTPVDAAVLEHALGVPVVPVVARTGRNVAALREAICRAARAPRRWRMVEAGEATLAVVREAVAAAGVVPAEAEEGEALRLLTNAPDDDPSLAGGGEALREAVRSARRRLEAEGIDRVAVEAECRYALCNDLARRARRQRSARASAASERIDRLLTHRVLGPVIYVVLMGTIFQAVYAWATPFMDGIEAGTGWLGGFVAGLLGEGMLSDLLVDGVIAGVGNILVFLPQICLLFLFLTLLEDVGYLSRAAFLVDRIMRGVGLNGKAFIPLMSSFACAIPGIMATRTIESRRDRLVTILVAPLMSCSARLPVYALMIGAFVPEGYQGLTLLSMYLLSVVAGLTVAWVLRRTLFPGGASTFILELPSYKLPGARHVAQTVLDRGWVFVRQAGTIILAISIILWCLAYFPRSEEVEREAQARIEAGEDPAGVENWERAAQMEQSFAGTLGRALEPALEPLGFDWKIGIGLVASFAAREVLVSTLGIVYSVGEADETSGALRERLRHAKRADGSPTFTWLTALSLMVFFVLACQCMSTLAVVRRETNSWRWPLFMFGYMTVLAYVGSLVVYQGGLALGLV